MTKFADRGKVINFRAKLAWKSEELRGTYGSNMIGTSKKSSKKRK